MASLARGWVRAGAAGRVAASGRTRLRVMARRSPVAIARQARRWCRWEGGREPGAGGVGGSASGAEARRRRPGAGSSARWSASGPGRKALEEEVPGPGAASGRRWRGRSENRGNDFRAEAELVEWER